MEAPTPMTHEELLELAALDAFGLLDEYEAALYTRSFHKASAAVQQQIVELQAELVADESLLPGEEPDPSLRQRVLKAVSQAVESEAADLAPLASIGRAPRAAEPVVAQSHQPRVSIYFWRAAVFALTASLLVVGYFFHEAYNHNNELTRTAISENTRDQLEDLIGPTFKEFLNDPNARRVALTSADPEEFRGSAMLYIKEDEQQVFLLGVDIPQTAQPYTLVATASDGSTQTLRSFDTNGTIVGIRVDGVAGNVLASNQWSITDSNGTVLLRNS